MKNYDYKDETKDVKGKVSRNLTHPDGPVATYDIVGNICESADYFARDREVAHLTEGDIVGVMNAGAYGISMASTYNMRSLPAEVWVDVNNKATEVRKRKTAKDIVDEALSSGNWNLFANAHFQWG